MRLLLLIAAAGGLAVEAGMPVAADPVIFLGQPAYVDDVPVHIARQRLRGRGTYADPYYLEDDYGVRRDYVPEQPLELRPRDLARILRAQGFHGFADIERFRMIYGVTATDADGNRVRLAVDARTGEIRHARLLARSRDYFDDDAGYDDRRYEAEPRQLPRRSTAAGRTAQRVTSVAPPLSRPLPAGRAPDTVTAAVEPTLVVPPVPKSRPAVPPEATDSAAPSAMEPKEPAAPAETTAAVAPSAPPAATPPAVSSAGETIADSAPPPTKPKKPVVTYRPPANAEGDAIDPEIGNNPLVIY